MAQNPAKAMGGAVKDGAMAAGEEAFGAIKEQGERVLAVAKQTQEDVMAVIGAAKKQAGMFYDPTSSQWATADPVIKAKAKKAGTCSAVAFWVSAIIFIAVVLASMDITAKVDVIESVSSPTYADYTGLVAADKRNLECKCTQTQQMASQIGTWSYSLDEFCGITAKVTAAYPATTIKESFDLYNTASQASNYTIPAVIITSFAKLSEICEVSDEMMKKAEEKFAATTMYTPIVQKEAELQQSVKTLLIDPDYIWPAFFNLHSMQLDVWGSINRPLVADTFSQYEDGFWNTDTDSAQCYSSPIHTELNTDSTVDNPYDGVFLEVTRKNADPLRYDKVLQTYQGNVTDVCDTTNPATADYNMTVYCNSYATFLGSPLKDISTKWKNLCTAGEDTFVSSMNTAVPAQGDILLSGSKMSSNTPAQMMAKMMLVGKPSDTLVVDHAKHFEVCAPAECTYIVSKSPSASAVFGIIIGIFGGFDAIFRSYVFPTFVFPIVCVLFGAMTLKEVTTNFYNMAMDAIASEVQGQVKGVVSEQLDPYTSQITEQTEGAVATLERGRSEMDKMKAQTTVNVE